MNIDKVYIVHYYKLTERKNDIIERLNANGFTNYEFMSNYPRDIIDDNIIKKYFKYDGIKLNNTQIAISIEHIEIYRDIINKNYKWALILEDDAYFDNNFSFNLNESLKTLPSDADYCCLTDGCGVHHSPIISGTYWYKNIYTRTVAGYLINNNFCKKILDSIIPFKTAIDNQLNIEISKLGINAYWREPTLISQLSGFKYNKSY